MITLAIIATVAAVAIIQYLLPRYGPNFLGSIIPTIFTIAAVILIIKTGFSGMRDVLIPLVALFALLSIWGRAIEVKKTKSQEEMEKIDRQIT